MKNLKINYYHLVKCYEKKIYNIWNIKIILYIIEYNVFSKS